MPTPLLGPNYLAGTDYSRSLNIPKNAGKYRDAMTMVLLRIGDGWNQSISCGPGWYPLIAMLHINLCDLDIDYEVRGVRERQGKLSYDAMSDIENGKIHKQFRAYIADAERRSTEICEWCGESGQLCTSKEHSWRLYKTLCSCCEETWAERGQDFHPLAP